MFEIVNSSTSGRGVDLQREELLLHAAPKDLDAAAIILLTAIVAVLVIS